ncbi:B-cell CLL/lymphoma 6 member B protein [Elysia marginata]|uniref:B-cell CLL/lymphoma 6 member B protein n=1 Tax=Elysia marginata TaxID=1093978 RepID=A0AAV4G8L9_9GAST|nr:B-cell CLL/lymphoma 6 member B protein [Elysia marginata]
MDLFKRDKLAGDKASERKDSFFVIHSLCVCVCPIDYGPCRRNELASVIKNMGGVRGVKQLVLDNLKLLLRKFYTCPRNARPRTCLHCNTTYTASTSLSSHLRSITGIGIWTCSRCKYSSKPDTTFTRKHSLCYHILKENDIPRYICLEPGCNKKHNHTHHQKSHARQHAGEKDFQCCIENCAMMFTNRIAYSQHLLQIHNVKLLWNNKLKKVSAPEQHRKSHKRSQQVRSSSKAISLQGSDSTPNYSQMPHSTSPKSMKRAVPENISQVPSFEEKDTITSPKRMKKSVTTNVNQVTLPKESDTTISTNMMKKDVHVNVNKMASLEITSADMMKREVCTNSNQICQVTSPEDEAWEESFEDFKAQVDAGEIYGSEFHKKFLYLFGSHNYSFNVLYYVSCFEFKGTKVRPNL